MICSLLFSHPTGITLEKSSAPCPAFQFRDGFNTAIALGDSLSQGKSRRISRASIEGGTQGVSSNSITDA
jgi:hypothetical protein